MVDRSEMALRIDEVIRRQGTREAFAARSGIPLPSLDRYCRGDSDVPSSRLGLIARAAGVSADFLIFGGELSSNVTMLQPRSSDLDDVVMIPVLDVIASAGPGIENRNPLELKRLPFPRAWLARLRVPEEHARFLDSRGDSMVPTIPEDAICLCDTRFQRPGIDGVYVLVVGGDVRIKRIGRGFDGRVTLISDNERYETEPLSPAEAGALKVEGRVVWAGGEI